MPNMLYAYVNGNYVHTLTITAANTWINHTQQSNDINYCVFNYISIVTVLGIHVAQLVEASQTT